MYEHGCVKWKKYQYKYANRKSYHYGCNPENVLMVIESRMVATRGWPAKRKMSQNLDLWTLITIRKSENFGVLHGRLTTANKNLL